MDDRVNCPKCNQEVLLNKIWTSQECPVCGLGCCWDVDYNRETGDEWFYVEWKNYEKEG